VGKKPENGQLAGNRGRVQGNERRDLEKMSKSGHERRDEKRLRASTDPLVKYKKIYPHNVTGATEEKGGRAQEKKNPKHYIANRNANRKETFYRTAKYVKKN